MSLKFVVHGIEVTASDAAEAAKLIRELGAQSAQVAPEMPAKPQVNGKHRAAVRAKPRPGFPSRKVRSEEFNIARGTLSFLSAINEHGDRGVSGEELIAPFNVNHIKGVGSRIGQVNGQLSKLGFAPESVYATRRTSEGRFFIPAKDFEAALEAAKKAVR